MDTIAQMLHVLEVLHPQRVQYLQINFALQLTHDVRTKIFFALFVQPSGCFQCRIEAVLVLGFGSELLERLLFQRNDSRKLLLKSSLVIGGKHGQLTGFLLYQFFHFATDVALFQDLPPHTVDRLAMAVHHIIILNNIFARIKIISFNLFLRAFQCAADGSVLNWCIFVNPQPIHKRPNTFALENTHQVVLSADIELCQARIALAATAAAQLIVDTPRLVSFRTNHHQPAQLAHTFTQHNVRTTAGNVGRQRDGALLTSLDNNGGLALVVFGVEDFVCDTSTGEWSAKQLVLLDRGAADQYWPPLLVIFRHITDNGTEFTGFGFEDHVRPVFANNRLVRRYLDNVQAVNLLEFLGFGKGRTGHTAELLVQTEVVLE